MATSNTRIILHIGQHKTGTTAIQRYLHRTSSALTEQGVLYPELSRIDADGDLCESHRLLAWSVVQKYQQKYGVGVSKDLWVSLRREIEAKRPKIAILSSEFFWSATENEVNEIVDNICGYPVRIILYLRNPLSLAASAYKQGIKTGHIKEDFRSYCYERLRMFDYDATIKRWSKGFGRPNVNFRIYDKVKRNLVADFVKTAGFEIVQDKANSTRENISPSDGTIKLLRSVNRYETLLPEGLQNYVHRARRNIVKGRKPGSMVATVAETIIGGALVTTKDVGWLRDTTAEMQERFLSNHVTPEDRHFFKF